MLNLFRRHVAACRHHGARTGQSCPRKPPCPIHVEGTNGEGQRQPPQALLDPATGRKVSDWERACEILRMKEKPVPRLQEVEQAAIQAAVAHWLNIKHTQSAATFDHHRRVLGRFVRFMQGAPRHYQYLAQIAFPDLTDFCCSWTQSTSSKISDLTNLISFLKYCFRAELTADDLGVGLTRTLNWRSVAPPREPFSAEELERLWTVWPQFAALVGTRGPEIAQQTEAFVYLMRYTGMDLSTTMMLSKSHLRENHIRTYRLKNGSEVWTVIPEWVLQKLQAAPHDSEQYFFWSGKGTLETKTSKWSHRLRRLLDLAGLQHRSPHNFRHHFAVEHLLNGTPIEDVSRLLGHNDIHTTIRSYAAWVKQRQENLEKHQQQIWAHDALHQQMLTRK